MKIVSGEPRKDKLNSSELLMSSPIIEGIKHSLLGQSTRVDSLMFEHGAL